MPFLAVLVLVGIALYARQYKGRIAIRSYPALIALMILWAPSWAWIVAANVLLEAPLVELVTDDDGAVVGGVARRRDGFGLGVKARRGVVLGAGGFAHNERLRKVGRVDHALVGGALAALYVVLVYLPQQRAIGKLAEEVIAAQESEIAWMRDWLDRRGA